MDTSWIKDPSIDNQTVLEMALKFPQDYAREALDRRMWSDKDRIQLEEVIASLDAVESSHEPASIPASSGGAEYSASEALVPIAGGGSPPGGVQRRRRYGCLLSFLAAVVVFTGGVFAWWTLFAPLVMPGASQSSEGAQSMSAPVSEASGVLRAGASSFTCQTSTDRTGVWCWGGVGDETLPITRVEGVGSPLAFLDVGRGFGVGVDIEGRVLVWGDSRAGQSGVVGGVSWVAVEVAQLDAPPAQVVAGAEHACVLVEDSSVWCFGANRFGQVRGVPTASGVGWTRVGVDVPVVSIGSSGYDMWAIGVDGLTWVWGANTRGAAHPADSAASLPPTLLPEFPDVLVEDGGQSR